MIRKQEKPMLTAPAMSPGEYEAAVAAFIRNRGVTRCPTACLVRTQASVSAADRAALEQYEAGRERSRRTTVIETAKSLGLLLPSGENMPNRAVAPVEPEAQTTRSRCSAAISASP